MWRFTKNKLKKKKSVSTRITYFVVCNNLWILERYVCLLTLRKKANYRIKFDCLYKEYDFLQKFTIMSIIRFHFIILNSINYYIMYICKGLYLKNKHIIIYIPKKYMMKSSVQHIKVGANVCYWSLWYEAHDC